MEKFRELGLSEEVLKTLQKMGIETPSEIQEKAIPLALKGKDLIGASKTGSGKTLAFASAIIENVDPSRKIKAIVLTPTRELAEQVSDSIREFSKKNLKIVSVYGGVNFDMQVRKLRGADVIVGTPGRVLDHLKRRTISLSKVEILILDEFDRMLDMGFQRDVGAIIDTCPKDRQTMLFSATFSADVEYLASRYTNNPIQISVESRVDYSKLQQIYYDTPDGLKFSLLVQLLKEEPSHLVMIFCSTRRNADFVTTNLNNLGINAKAIHGGLDQKKRIKVLKEFHEDKGLNILVCTDVAARGLDIKGVSHVYNYDMPQVSSDYVHRIGRTARAGMEGKAINILCSRDYENFSDIINHEDVRIDEVELPYVKKVEIIKDTGRRNDSRGRDSRGRSDSRGRDSRGRNDSRSRDSRGRNDSRGRDSRREPVVMYDAVCMKCGKPCKVPFKPTTGKGVSCSECFVPREGPSQGRGQRRDSNSRRGNDSRGRNDSRRNSRNRR